MRHVNTVAALSGPLVVLGYLASATLYVWLRRLPAPQLPGPEPVRRTLPYAVPEAVLAVVVATVAWHTILFVAPGNRGFVIDAPSAVGYLSSQVLAVWESVALWTGLAAIVGHAAPIWTRFERGGSGLPPAMALGFVYAPWAFVVGIFSWFAALAIGRSPRAAIPAALGAILTFEWLAWWNDWPAAWGTDHGPELALWTMVVCGVLVTRWHRGDVPAPPTGPTGAT